jgi:3'(2'), 5'-bisphosphate nucleotidase
MEKLFFSAPDLRYMDFNISAISNLAVNAGERIMGAYDDEDNAGWTMLKPDCTPVTMDDIESQMVIWAGLREMYPGVPVVSEEGQVIEDGRPMLGVIYLPAMEIL